MLLKVDCLPNAVGKQPSIPLIYLGRKWTLNWWWWWWWTFLLYVYGIVYITALNGITSAWFVVGFGGLTPSVASHPPSLYWPPEKIVEISQKYIADPPLVFTQIEYWALHSHYNYWLHFLIMNFHRICLTCTLKKLPRIEFELNLKRNDMDIIRLYPKEMFI